MYKLKIVGIIVLAIIGALLIYNHFNNKNQQQQVIDKFSSEYNLVSENNVFDYSSIDEVIDILDSKTDIIFFCTPTSKWCNQYASLLNLVLIKNNINKIKYYDIKRDRELNTLKYQKVLEKLSQFLYKDDLENSKLYMPELIIVKSGEIIAHDNETSLIASDIDPSNYWTQEKIIEFENKITNYINLLNN